MKSILDITVSTKLLGGFLLAVMIAGGISWIEITHHPGFEYCKQPYV